MHWRLASMACAPLAALLVACGGNSGKTTSESEVKAATVAPAPAPQPAATVPQVVKAPVKVVAKPAVVKPPVKTLQLSTQKDEIGLLFRHDATNFVMESCTGTLVQTSKHAVHNIVLTAKHCLDVDTFYIGEGQLVAYPDDHDWQKVTSGMKAYKVVATVELDDGDVEDHSCPHGGLDMRLLQLERDVPDIIPALLASRTPDLKAECKFVGFGVRPDQMGGTFSHLGKRSFPVELSSLAGNGLVQTAVDKGVPSRGDSGGPLFCAGLLVGTDSCGVPGDSYLNLDQGYARVDLVLDKIDAAIANWLPNLVAQR